MSWIERLTQKCINGFGGVPVARSRVAPGNGRRRGQDRFAGNRPPRPTRASATTVLACPVRFGISDKVASLAASEASCSDILKRFFWRCFGPIVGAPQTDGDTGIRRIVADISPYSRICRRPSTLACRRTSGCKFMYCSSRNLQYSLYLAAISHGSRGCSRGGMRKKQAKAAVFMA